MNQQWIETTGWFGKLPGNGDFISHNISQKGLSFLDSMLSELMVLVCSKPEATETYFQTRPVSLWMNIEELGGHQGFLMPSVDAAGRPFPWIAVRKHCRAFNLSWQHTIAELSYQALDQNWSGLDFQNALETLVQENNERDIESFNELELSLPSEGVLYWEKGTAPIALTRLAICPPNASQWSEILHA